MRLSALLFALAAPVAAQAPNPLAGNWRVDLSTDPARPYVKDMRLILAPDGGVSGSFYDSAIEGGRWKTDRGRTCVSFRTSDGVGPYHSSASSSQESSLRTDAPLATTTSRRSPLFTLSFVCVEACRSS